MINQWIGTLIVMVAGIIIGGCIENLRYRRLLRSKQTQNPKPSSANTLSSVSANPNWGWDVSGLEREKHFSSRSTTMSKKPRFLEIISKLIFCLFFLVFSLIFMVFNAVSKLVRSFRPNRLLSKHHISVPLLLTIIAICFLVAAGLTFIKDYMPSLMGTAQTSFIQETIQQQIHQSEQTEDSKKKIDPETLKKIMDAYQKQPGR